LLLKTHFERLERKNYSAQTSITGRLVWPFACPVVKLYLSILILMAVVIGKIRTRDCYGIDIMDIFTISRKEYIQFNLQRWIACHYNLSKAVSRSIILIYRLTIIWFLQIWIGVWEQYQRVAEWDWSRFQQWLNNQFKIIWDE